MSYGTLYTLEFPDYFDRDIQVLIEEQDYAGASTDIKGGEVPLTISWKTPSDFILDPINGSVAKIGLKSETDFQFLNLYTNSNRKYRVTININGTLKWKGFLLPDQYQEDYKQTPYDNEFIASDQLGFLKTLAWDRENVETEITTLGAILAKTDLELNLFEGLNIYENNHNSTTADSPLDQTYINPKAFTDKTYYDVLKAILFKYAAVIKQDRGYWWIYRPEEAIASYQIRLWTYSAGVFTYNNTILNDPVVSSTSATVAKNDLVRITAGGMFINAAWQKYQLTQNYGKIDSALENPNFTDWTLGIPDNWSKSSGHIQIIREGDGVRMRADSTTVGYIAQRLNTGYSRIKFKLEWDVRTVAGFTMNVDIRLRHRSGVYGHTYDFDLDLWSSSDSFYRNVYDNSGGSDAVWESGSVEFVTQAYSGNTDWIEIQLNNPVSAGAGGGHMIWKSASAEIMKEDGSDVIDYDADKVIPVTINPANNFDGGDFKMLLSDVGVNDSSLIYKGGLWLDSDQLISTDQWTGAGITGILASLLQSSISKLLSQPQQVISVPIYSMILFSTSVIQEINNSNRLFMIRRATWDVLNGIWDIEGFEIGIGEGAALLNEDGEQLLNEDGSTLINE